MKLLLNQSAVHTQTELGGVGDAAKVVMGGTVQPITLADGVTTDTTSPAQVGPPGFKTFWAQVVGTGAVSVTVKVYGDINDDETGGVLLATITLSGTTQAQDAAASITANYPYLYAVTESISGTGASVTVKVFY